MKVTSKQILPSVRLQPYDKSSVKVSDRWKIPYLLDLPAGSLNIDYTVLPESSIRSKLVIALVQCFAVARNKPISHHELGRIHLSLFPRQAQKTDAGTKMKDRINQWSDTADFPKLVHSADEHTECIIREGHVVCKKSSGSRSMGKSRETLRWIDQNYLPLFNRSGKNTVPRSKPIRTKKLEKSNKSNDQQSVLPSPPVSEVEIARSPSPSVFTPEELDDFYDEEGIYVEDDTLDSLENVLDRLEDVQAAPQEAFADMMSLGDDWDEILGMLPAGTVSQQVIPETVSQQDILFDPLQPQTQQELVQFQQSSPYTTTELQQSPFNIVQQTSHVCTHCGHTSPSNSSPSMFDPHIMFQFFTMFTQFMQQQQQRQHHSCTSSGNQQPLTLPFQPQPLLIEQTQQTQQSSSLMNFTSPTSSMDLSF